MFGARGVKRRRAEKATQRVLFVNFIYKSEDEKSVLSL